MGEMALSQLAIYNARPAVRICGRTSALADELLQQLAIEEAEGGMSRLVAEFLNWASRDDGGAQAAFENETQLAFGAEIAVYCGEHAAPTEVFRGKVSALEYVDDNTGAPRLVVHAEDALAQARLARRIDTYVDMSVADVARAVASRAGLTPVVDLPVDLTGTWVQLSESDLAFLRRLLARVDGDCQVIGGELHVKRVGAQRNAVTLAMRSQLRRVRVVADLAQQATTVRVTGFDPLEGEAVAYDATRAAGDALGGGSGRSGADLLRQHFGERLEQVAHALALRQDDARALAESQFARRARGFVTARGVAEGNPALRVGTRLTLAELSPRFDNTYTVTACLHRFDLRRGYETEFTAECAYLGSPE